MAWTDIAQSDVSANANVTEDTMTALCDNEQYNYDHGVRGGTDAVGVRLVLARGKHLFSAKYLGAPGNTTLPDEIYSTGNIYFAGESIDGNPNFISAPLVFVTLEELIENPTTGKSSNEWAYQGTGTNENFPPVFWGPTTGMDNVISPGNLITLEPMIGVRRDGFSYHVGFDISANDTARITGYLHWVAIGLVSERE